MPVSPIGLAGDALHLAHCVIDWRVAFGANPFDQDHAGDQVLQAASVPTVFQSASGQQAYIVSTNAGMVPAPLLQLDNPAPAAAEEALTRLDANLLANMEPDGFHIAPAASTYQPLGYHLPPLPFSSPTLMPLWPPPSAMTTGFIVERPSAGFNGSSPALQGTHEMEARHLSLWIKPTVDWTLPNTNGGLYPIWELRAPPAAVSPQSYDERAGSDWHTTRIAGSTGSQNALALVFDAKHNLLILVIAPPSIEQTHDSAIAVPDQDPSNQMVDTSTLGAASGLPLQSLAPSSIADNGALLRTVTAVYEPNRVLHCYAVPDAADGRPYFRANVWHHLQVAIASDRPEGTAIIVDGIVGQDIATRDGVMRAMGDHCTLPCLPLATAVPMQAIASGDPHTAAGPTVPGGIRLAPITIGGVLLTATNLLPAHGIVRIDDEYFRYCSIAPDGLSLMGVADAGPLRGRRQDTQSTGAFNTSVPYDTAFPLTQQHLPKTLVTSGGYRRRDSAFREHRWRQRPPLRWRQHARSTISAR